MKVTLNIPTEEISDMVDFLCVTYDYQAKIYDPLDPMTQINNPETRQEFAKRNLITPLKYGFEKWLVRKAVRVMEVTSNVSIESIEQ